MTETNNSSEWLKEFKLEIEANKKETEQFLQKQRNLKNAKNLIYKVIRENDQNIEVEKCFDLVMKKLDDNTDGKELVSSVKKKLIEYNYI